MRKLLSILFWLLPTCMLFGQKDVYNNLFRKAINAGNEKEIIYYLDKGADINCLDSDGCAALHVCSRDGRIEIINLLLSKGANVNNLDTGGRTPLMYAAYNGDLRICYLLYKKGARLQIKDNSGIIAKTYADNAGYTRISNFLSNTNNYSESPTYYEILNRLDNKKSWESNSKILIEAYKLAIAEVEDKNPQLIDLLKKISEIFYDNNDFNNAGFIYKKIIDITSKKPNNEIEVATNHRLLGNIFFANKDWENAKVQFTMSSNIQKNILGENHHDYLRSIGCLADVYKETGLFHKADSIYNCIINTYERGNISDIDYSVTLNHLALIYSMDIRKHNEAETIFKKIIENNKIYHKSDVGLSIFNLADFYKQTGNYSLAELAYIESIKIFESDKSQPMYAKAIENIALLYNDMGKNNKVEQLHKEAIFLRQKYLGENHPDYASSLDNLAGYYYDMGDYIKAEPYYNKALELRRINSDKDSLDYAQSLNNVAGLYFQFGKYNQAENLLKHALFIEKQANVSNAYTINNLARLYAELERYDDALIFYRKSLDVFNKEHGTIHPDNAVILDNIAFVYNQTQRYIQAEEMYLKAFKLRKNTLDTLHINYLSSLNNLSMFYSGVNNYTKALSYYKELTRNLLTNVKSNFTFLSESERRAYWDKYEFILNDNYPSFVYNYHPQNPAISMFGYDNTLSTKGLLLNTSIQIQNAIIQSGDMVLINTWENLRGLKRQINLLQNKTLAQQGNLSVIEAQADSLDKVLTQKSQLYKQSQSDMQVKWTDVQKNLKPDEAAIEFISFDYYNKHYTDSTMYCALLLKKDSKYPEMIPLFEEKQLDSLFVKTSSDVNNLYQRVVNLRKDTVEQTLNYGSILYRLLWKPLEASLKDVKTVYYAPSGKLHHVAFAAIPVDSALLLSDKYNLHQLTSTRQVIHNNEQNKQAVKINEAALFGGIQYELDNKQLAQVQSTTDTGNCTVFVSDSTQRSGSFGFLKGTGEEVTGIAEEFKQRGLTEQLFTGAVASEAAFKKLSGTNTDIIHIATHGFYLPIEKTKREDFRFMTFDNDRRNVIVQNPLLRSGLAFAGANRAWRGDSIPGNWEDGILTSHEISQLNLTRTELVVLSACETALGDIKGSEGVFGLQRAFKMAGVKSMIVSLWKVDDAVTSQMMQSFYKYWLGGMSKHEAFKKAQGEIRALYPKDPYYWAAFVLID